VDQAEKMGTEDRHVGRCVAQPLLDAAKAKTVPAGIETVGGGGRA